MTTEAAQMSVELPASLTGVNALLDEKIHLLATSGHDTLAQAALDAAKACFELGLSHEKHSHPHLHPFLVSILQPPSVSLRSKTKAAKEAEEKDEEQTADPVSVLPYTPLSGLTTEGLDEEQIWAQLELRSEGIVKVIKEVGPGESADLEDAEDAEEESEEDEEDGSDEEMSVEEFKRMMAEQGIDEDMDSDEMEEESGSDDEDDDEDDDDEDDEDSDESEDGNKFSLKDMDGESDELSGDGDEDEDAEEDEEDEDDDMADLELEDEEQLDSEVDEEGEQEGSGEDDDQEALFGQPGPSRRRQHPTLDDQFFSIDDFNRTTEEAEAGRLSSGRLSGADDDEDEDDLGDAGAMMLQSADDDAGIMYNDFFDAPRGSKTKGKGKVEEKGKGKAKAKDKGKGKGKLRFAEDEEEEDGDDGEAEDGGREVLSRFKGDLFDSDDEDGEAADQPLSTHEKQQRALAAQIAELEQEAIGPKDWTLLGEATSRARPENSLLEEDLDFEQVAKVVPVITEDTVKSLEDLIRKRILENNFDSPVRVRAYEPTAFLPSRYLDLQDTQSSKSLAQIYEEEYQSAAAGGKTKDPRDEKLRKEHEEIDKLWGEICYKLDALSSLNFVPKQPKAQITTIDNLPTATMESALPPTSAATTLLAPEEAFAPPSAGSLVARTELTPEQAQAARNKKKREKKGDRRRLSDMAELYGKKGGAKAEKERALQGLVKTGKGVTVVGKGDKESGKANKRHGDEAERSDGKRLKL